VSEFEILISAFKEGPYLVNIYNVTGALIKTMTTEDDFYSKKMAVDLQDVAAGIYYIEIVNNFEKVTKKVVKY